jgi:hypothetical protein
MPNSYSATQKTYIQSLFAQKNQQNIFRKKIDFRQLVEKNAKILFFDLGVKNLL